MPHETALDRQIVAAIASLREPGKTEFDIDRYRRAFHRSAQEKADAVLQLLDSSDNPLRGRRPVFVSIGGADGAELRVLLSQSTGTLGVLLEGLKPLADIARTTPVTPGKKIEVIEGDAAAKLSEAMTLAEAAVHRDEADYVVVTCHAVVHELFDRSHQFDEHAFFGRIFQNRDVPIWFSYREPGTPEKWPEQILLKADCSPASLLKLAEAIRERHPSFKTSNITPIVIGDHLRADRALAMEILCKLFYLDDLQHEIEERSTSVRHEMLKSLIMLAIGAKAAEARRADLSSESAASDSFKRNWNRLRVSASGLDGSATQDLPVPESHSRVTAYRLPDADNHPTARAGDDDTAVAAQLAVAASALTRGDVETLTTLTTAFGRYWIETRRKGDALRFMHEIIVETPAHSQVHLFSRYLCDISDLFTGNFPRQDAFSDSMIDLATHARLDLLYSAERMEFARKAGLFADVLERLNHLQEEVATRAVGLTNVERYVAGVVNFVIANALRGGGLYRDALLYIDAAEQTLVEAVPSHLTELFHCAYARAVCDSMRGTVNLPRSANEPGALFAAALIRVTYSHAAWFAGDVTAAIDYAESASTAFSGIDHTNYATRATILANLIRLWLPKTGNPQPSIGTADLTHGVHFLLGYSSDRDRFHTWFSTLRPSVAVGLLQLRQLRSAPMPAFEVQLPAMLRRNEQRRFEIVSPTASSLDEADATLRQQIGVGRDVRLPLYPD